jgi:hypothetical protein
MFVVREGNIKRAKTRDELREQAGTKMGLKECKICSQAEWTSDKMLGREEAKLVPLLLPLILPSSAS